VAALFEVRVEEDASGFARVRWSKVEAWREWARLSEGCYVLRSNVTDWTPEDLWRACRTVGLGDEPRKVFEELSKVALVEVALPTRTGVTIRKRCVSRPTEHQAILLQRLGLQSAGRARFRGRVVKTRPHRRCKHNHLSFKLRKLG
jgi:hypothetical protein